MPGTFSPPPPLSDPDMHHGTCVTHVPWCMPGSITSGFLWSRRRGKTFPAFPAQRATRNYTYLVRGPWANPDPAISDWCLGLFLLSYIGVQTYGPWFRTDRLHSTISGTIEPCKWHAYRRPLGIRVVSFPAQWYFIDFSQGRDLPANQQGLPPSLPKFLASAGKFGPVC